MNKYIKPGEILLRQIALRRAGNQCEMCRDTYMLDNHHLLPKSEYPQHRLNPKGTVILCRMKCHDLAENHPKEFLAAARLNDNLVDRMIWFDQNRCIGKHPAKVDYEKHYLALQEYLTRM